MCYIVYILGVMIEGLHYTYIKNMFKAITSQFALYTLQIEIKFVQFFLGLSTKMVLYWKQINQFFVTHLI